MSRDAELVRQVFEEKDRLFFDGRWDWAAFDKAYSGLQRAGASGEDFAALFAFADNDWLPVAERREAILRKGHPASA